MKTKKKLIGFALLPALLATGCAGMTNADRGTLGGGLLGAGVGAVIGKAAHNTAAGALIGGATGAVIGNIAGRSEDRAQAQAVAQARARALSLEDIRYMSQSGTSDVLIINQIRTSGAVYNLNAAQLVWLKDNRVSDAVVSEMQATAARYAGPSRVYVAEPPPVAVGVGIGFGR